MMGVRGERAEALFLKGYNCCQAVLLSFSDLTGLEDDVALKLASSFGGGLARMREVCGAVSGAAMVLGLLKGYSQPLNEEIKKAHYRLVQEYARRFKEKNGSIVCRELLSGVKVKEGRDPEERTPEYYRKRPCPKLIHLAADLLDEMISDPSDR